MDKGHQIQADLFGLYAELELSTLLDKMAEKIKQTLACEEASIFLYNPGKETLTFHIVTGKKGDVLKQITLARGEGVAGWVAHHRQSLIIPDCRTDPRFSSRSDQTSSFITRSIIAAPVQTAGSLIGVLEGINKLHGSFSAADEDNLSIIARYIAIPLQNALFFHQLRMESLQKDLLLGLAREIAVANRFEDLFPSLHDLIGSQCDALEIRMRVMDSSGKNIGKTVQKNKDPVVSGHPYRFPFLSGKGKGGALYLKSRHELSEGAVHFFSGLARFLALMADKLEMEEERIINEKTEKELEIARSIQQSFLITEAPQIRNLDSCFINIPSSKVGGDYYDLIKLPSEDLLFIIADIAGHGIPASLLMSIFRANFCYHAPRDSHMSETVAKTNDLIARTTAANHYLSAFCGHIDQTSQRLSYINAGHPAPLIIRGSEQIKLDSNNMTIGMFPDLSFCCDHIDLKPGDLLLFYTDGVVETENRHGQQFGLERCASILQSHASAPLTHIMNRIVRSLKAFLPRNHFEDDITLLLLRILPSPDIPLKTEAQID